MTAPAQTSDILPFQATETTLATGLRVIIVPTGFPNLVTLQVPVQTGSRNEVEPGKSGFAHFFEHMMFRGTKRFPPERYQAIVTRTGARQNAYTTDDYTNYHITFAREDLEAILEIEADRFANLEYAESDFRTEARAILGEYNKSSSDPMSKLIEVQRDHAYNVHPYKHTTMGFIADIEAMPEQYDYSRTFFRRWYRPEYTTIILAGDVDPAEALALVEKHWGGWHGGGEAPPAIPAEPAATGPVSVHVPWPAPTLPIVTVGFHGPAFDASSVEYAALDVLLDLAFGETSDVYQDLVERRQLVDQLFAWGGANADPGLFTVFARVKDPADAPAVRAAIVAAIAHARSEPADVRRLEDAKANMRYGLARTLDNSDAIGSLLARFVRYERSYDTLNQLFRTYEKLTAADLEQAARTYLTDANMVLAALSHDPLPAELEVLPTVEAAPVSVADGPAVPELVLRSPSPLLRFKLLFSVGSAHDPVGREGLATLAADMLAAAGSSRQRIDEINRALFPMAGSFSAMVDREMTTFTGVIHRDNIERFFDIALPQLLEPGYREDDFARLKAMQQAALVQDLRSSNDEELGKERLQSVIFAGTPYGHPSLGTVSGIEAITLDDVRAFAAQHFVRANLVLGAAGDFPEASFARLQAAVTKLPPGETASTPQVEGRRAHGLAVDIVAKETRATAISFGHPLTVTRSHPDFAALWLARSWLGEHRATPGRLFQRLREVRGLNYGDYAYIEAFPGAMYGFFPEPNRARRAQLFEIWIRPVVPAQAVFALKAALFELRQLLANGISEEDFEASREYLTKNVFQATKTQEQQLGSALDGRWFGVGDYVSWMRGELARLTAAAVNEAMRRHLSGEDLHVVMISGEAEALRDQLLAGGFTGIAYEAPRPQEVLDEDQRIGAIDLALTPERVRITPVEDVFA